jgi:hypothetical protein
MFYKPLFPVAIALATALILPFANRAVAQPADLLVQHLEQIQRQMPDHYVVRFPEEILLGGPGLDHLEQLIVKVIPSDAPQQVIVNLQTCEAQPYPCLVGSFSFAPSHVPDVQAEFTQHQALAKAVTLTPTITGYLVEGDAQPQLEQGTDPTATSAMSGSEPLPQMTRYSTVMWQQDGMVYGIRFLTGERQNILYMARSMALQPPLSETAQPSESTQPVEQSASR